MSEAEAVPAVPSVGLFPQTMPAGLLTGLFPLGPANPSAVKRLAIIASDIVKNKKPIPESPFCEWAADRVCGEDRQDLVFFLQGRRGSGKSYSFLYVGKRLAEAIARRKGGTWKNYFSLKNIAALEDTEKVLELLNNSSECQVVLIDDAAIAISNRSWNSPENKNFNALLTVCRTRRWILLLTAPLRKHVDVQTRELCDLTGVVFKSFHKGGFNLLKITSSDISSSGKEYTHRLNFGGKRIDMWIAFAPDPDLAKEYDIARAESAKQMNERIVQTGTFKGSSSPKQEKKRIDRTEQHDLEFINEHGPSMTAWARSHPDASINQLAARFGVGYHVCTRLASKLGITFNRKPKPRDV